jgi:hypothetical protein
MLFNLKIYLLGDVLMFQAIENDACGEHFFCTQLLFVCCFLGSEEALQFDTFKALKYLLFLQLAGRGSISIINP